MSARIATGPSLLTLEINLYHPQTQVDGPTDRPTDTPTADVESRARRPARGSPRPTAQQNYIILLKSRTLIIS